MYEELENDDNRPFDSGTGVQQLQKKPAVANYCNDTVYDEQGSSHWPRALDESFEVLEKMCNKTVSDPNSTLFKYWHSDNKEQVVADVKKRSADGNVQLSSSKEAKASAAENEALERLLYELSVEEQTQLEDVSPVKGVEVTQLEDIEAPSKLWENTIIGDSSTALQTSPVKMVGLLRPSTIIEEGCEEFTIELEDEDLSSQMSFQSAVKSSEASVSYETAHDSTNASTAMAPKMPESHAAESESTSNDDSLAALAATDLEKSVDLINLDKTLQVASHASQSVSDSSVQEPVTENSPLDQSSNTDDSDCVIELLSDDDNEENNAGAAKPIITDELEQPSLPVDVSNADSCVDVAAHIAAYEDENKENCVYPDEEDEQSLHFNDTMEEVEYMMKKGMQYMAAAGAPSNIFTMTTSTQTAVLPPIVKQLKTKENTFLLSPKRNDRYRSPSPMLHKHKSNSSSSTSAIKGKFAYPKGGGQPTSATKSKPQKRFALDIKPMPKLNVFKKPATAIPTSIGTRPKEACHKQFPHIVSPIGAYMKKTGSTPLMANFKQTSSQDTHNATVFRELEYGTRVYQPKFESRPLVASNAPSLPKKAYISSEFKHIVDERTPVTIPGGKKIQKYLEGAMLPTIVRHEGKLKMTEAEAAANVGKTTSASVCTRNASLANLSVMSGDISVYTMRDAQKF